MTMTCFLNSAYDKGKKKYREYRGKINKVFKIAWVAYY